jgi:hypothetical protein
MGVILNGTELRAAQFAQSKDLYPHRHGLEPI